MAVWPPRFFLFRVVDFVLESLEDLLVLLVYGDDGEGLTFHVLLPFGRTLGLLECVDDQGLLIGGDVDFWHRFVSCGLCAYWHDGCTTMLL